MYMFTQCTCLQSVQVYMVYMFTQCTGLHGVLVYMVYMFTQCTCLHGVQVYIVYGFTQCTGYKGYCNFHSLAISFSSVPRCPIISQVRGLSVRALS